MASKPPTSARPARTGVQRPAPISASNPGGRYFARRRQVDRGRQGASGSSRRNSRTRGIAIPASRQGRLVREHAPDRPAALPGQTAVLSIIRRSGGSRDARQFRIGIKHQGRRRRFRHQSGKGQLARQVLPRTDEAAAPRAGKSARRNSSSAIPHTRQK